MREFGHVASGATIRLKIDTAPTLLGGIAECVYALLLPVPCESGIFWVVSVGKT